MQKYKNLSGQSGVSAYEAGDDFIRIEFKKNNSIYLYDHNSPGPEHVKEMIKKATDGIGLNTYINKKVRKNFAQREK